MSQNYNKINIKFNNSSQKSNHLMKSCDATEYMDKLAKLD